MSNELAQLVFPEVRWHEDGYGSLDALNAAVDGGIGGAIISGGDQDAARVLIRDIRKRAKIPLLVGAEMERGAGQQFTGATGLPPLAAVASLNDPDPVRRAARLAAREARTIGVNWILGPTCDLDLDDKRARRDSLGSDGAAVGKLVTEWVAACQAEGVLACARDFPGAGRPVENVNGVPVIAASAEAIHAGDLVPFRAAATAASSSVLAASVAYPALDPARAPAALSREIVQWLLRNQLKFDGLVAADLPTLAAATGQPETEIAVRALSAGCDIVLRPTDPAAVIGAIVSAAADRTIDREHASRALRRRFKWAQWASPPNDWRRPAAADVAWGLQLGERVIQVLREPVPALRSPVEVIRIGEGPSCEPLLSAIRAGGGQSREVDSPTPGQRSTIIAAVYSGEHTPTDAMLASLAAVESAAKESGRDLLVIQFGHPKQWPANSRSPVISAWCDDPAMQAAAGRWLAKRK